MYLSQSQLFIFLLENLFQISELGYIYVRDTYLFRFEGLQLHFQIKITTKEPGILINVSTILCLTKPFIFISFAILNYFLFDLIKLKFSYKTIMNI